MQFIPTAADFPMDVEIGSTPCKTEERASQLLTRQPFLAALL